MKLIKKKTPAPTITKKSSAIGEYYPVVAILRNNNVH